MRIVAAGLVAFGLLLSATAAAGAAPLAPAEQFVQDGADRAVAILKDKSLSDAARKQKLWDFLAELLDLKRTALYALGAAASAAPPDALTAYIGAYSRFALANYLSEVNGYGGEIVAVTGSVTRSDTDVIVNANILDAAAKPGTPPLAEVAFRVVKADGKFAIVDASVAGVWFTLAQHDDFQGFLAQNKGDVAALTERLNAMADRLASGAGPAGR